LLGRFAEAEGVYHTLIQVEPKRATAWNNLGNCVRQLGRRAEARRCYQRAIELDPNYIFALVNLAGLLDENKDRAGALALVQRALALAPADEMALKLLRNFKANAPARALQPPAWAAPLTQDWPNINEALALHQHVHKKRDDSRIVPKCSSDRGNWSIAAASWPGTRNG
jgi:Flp pilus assembly protein TadD